MRRDRYQTMQALLDDLEAFRHAGARRRRRMVSGMVLVGAMAAVAILASLTALMWASIANMFSVRDVVEQRSERFHQVRVSMNRMAKEIASTYVAGPEFGAEELPGESAEATMSTDELMDEATFEQSGAERLQLGMIGRDDELGAIDTRDHDRLIHGDCLASGRDRSPFLAADLDPARPVGGYGHIEFHTAGAPIRGPGNGG